MIEFSRIRPKLPGFSLDVDSFFFNFSGGKLKKINDYVANIWLNCGIPDVSVTVMRSSLSTYVGRFLYLFIRFLHVPVISLTSKV